MNIRPPIDNSPAPVRPEGAGAMTNSICHVETGSSWDTKWSLDHPRLPTDTWARTLPEKQAT